MPLEGHWERQHTPLRRLSQRERRLLALIGCVLAAALAATVLYAALHTPPRPAAGCIEVSAASTTGAARYRACGASATQWCRETARQHDAVARAVQAQCRALSRRRAPS